MTPWHLLYGVSFLINSLSPSLSPSLSLSLRLLLHVGAIEFIISLSASSPPGLTCCFNNCNFRTLVGTNQCDQGPSRDTLGSTEMMCSGRTGVWSRTEEDLVLSDEVSVFFERPAFGSFGAATLSRSSGQALALTRTLRARGFQHPYPPGIGFFALFHLQAPGANTTTSYLRP